MLVEAYEIDSVNGTVGYYANREIDMYDTTMPVLYLFTTPFLITFNNCVKFNADTTSKRYVVLDCFSHNMCHRLLQQSINIYVFACSTLIMLKFNAPPLIVQVLVILPALHRIP